MKKNYLFAAVAITAALFSGCGELSAILQSELESRSRTLVIVGADAGSSYTAEVFDYQAGIAPVEHEIWEGLLAAVKTVGGGIGGAPDGSVTINLRAYSGSGGFSPRPYLVRVTARLGTEETARYKAAVFFEPLNILIDWQDMRPVPTPPPAADTEDTADDSADGESGQEDAKADTPAALTPKADADAAQAVYRKVAFNTRGGNAIPSQTVESGEKARPPAPPARDGFSFAGWFTDNGLSTLYSFDSPVLDDITVYAGWFVVRPPEAAAADAASVNKTAPSSAASSAASSSASASSAYTVRFESRGGSAVPPQSVEAGGKAVRPKASPTREGYVFADWFADSGLKALYRFDNAVNADTAVYAGWIALFTVRFDSAGGSAVPSQTVARDKKAALPADPAREGYEFAGWFEDIGFTAPYTFDRAVNDDITLYAKWTPANE